MEDDHEGTSQENAIMTDAKVALARLMFQGTLTYDEFPALRTPAFRREVEAIMPPGYLLVQGEYRAHLFGMRMTEEMLTETGIDVATNKGLRTNHLALLVILWAKLRIPEMTIRDRALPKGGPTLSDTRNLELAREHEHGLQTKTLIAEFRHILGPPTTIRGLLRTLEDQQFILRRGDFILAGPMLEIGIDNRAMRDAILQFSRLDELRRKAESLPQERYEDSLENKVIQFFLDARGPVSKRQIEETFALTRANATRLIDSLVEQGVVTRTGKKSEGLYVHLDHASESEEGE